MFWNFFPLKKIVGFQGKTGLANFVWSRVWEIATASALFGCVGAFDAERKTFDPFIQYGPRERVHAGPQVCGRGSEGSRARDWGIAGAGPRDRGHGI